MGDRDHIVLNTLPLRNHAKSFHEREVLLEARSIELHILASPVADGQLLDVLRRHLARRQP